VIEEVLERRGLGVATKLRTAVIPATPPLAAIFLKISSVLFRG
jgi:hypothetical protein